MLLLGLLINQSFRVHDRNPTGETFFHIDGDFWQKRNCQFKRYKAGNGQTGRSKKRREKFVHNSLHKNMEKGKTNSQFATTF